jgi:D-alanyl-D-alanine carboxypeptidase/D-alanyl-D-alanine-endopeptidase (penicillin-binding protein 4)
MLPATRRITLPCLLLCAVGALPMPPAGAAQRSAPNPLLVARPDSTLQAAARRILGADQGAYVLAADGRVLVEQAAGRAVHPASLSKIPTTLALLQRLGAGYRFSTTLHAGGPLQDGVLRGDLWVEAEGDPFLVDESALRIAQGLRAAGVERIAGGLRASGPLYFDWQQAAAAEHLREALTGHAPRKAWQSLQPDPASESLPPMPAVAIAGAASMAGALPAGLPVLLVHRSPPLLALTKALNDYSNNVFAPLAAAVDGPGAVQAAARAAVPAAWQDEITLGDGAGMDPANRMSPRCVVALLRALEAQLALSQHGLPDILPVSGLDPGTLHARLAAEGEAGHLVGKTGTFGDYGASALAGALRTRAMGTVYFAILNHGVPVPDARRRQDAFVRALLARLDTLPWNYATPAHTALSEALLERVSEVAP